jgi:hypothetical protein
MYVYIYIYLYDKKISTRTTIKLSRLGSGAQDSGFRGHLKINRRQCLPYFQGRLVTSLAEAVEIGARFVSIELCSENKCGCTVERGRGAHWPAR